MGLSKTRPWAMTWNGKYVGFESTEERGDTTFCQKAWVVEEWQAPRRLKCEWLCKWVDFMEQTLTICMDGMWTIPSFYQCKFVGMTID